MELDIVTLFRDKNLYDRFFYLLKEEMFTREIWNVLNSLEEYYKEFPERDWVDMLEFAARFWHDRARQLAIEISDRIGYDAYCALIDTMPDEFTWYQLYTFLSNQPKAEPESQHEYILVTDGRAYFDEGGYNDNLIDRVVCCKCGQAQPERDDENVN